MDGGGVESARWSNWWKGTEIRRRRRVEEKPSAFHWRDGNTRLLAVRMIFVFRVKERKYVCLCVKGSRRCWTRHVFIFDDRSLSGSQQGRTKTTLICLLSLLPHCLSLAVPLSPLRCRILFFDKGLKNEVKRWQSFLPEEHLSPRQAGGPSLFLCRAARSLQTKQKTEPE